MCVAVLSYRRRCENGPHVHDGDAGLVQLFDRMLRGYADGTDEQPRFLLDDDVEQIVQLTFLVVVLKAGTGVQ